MATIDRQAQAVQDRQAILNMLESIRGVGEFAGAGVADASTLLPRGAMGAANTLLRLPNAFGADIPYIPETAFGGDSSSMTPFLDRVRAAQASAAIPDVQNQRFVGPPQELAGEGLKPLVRLPMPWDVRAMDSDGGGVSLGTAAKVFNRTKPSSKDLEPYIQRARDREQGAATALADYAARLQPYNMQSQIDAYNAAEKAKSFDQRTGMADAVLAFGAQMLKGGNDIGSALEKGISAQDTARERGYKQLMDRIGLGAKDTDRADVLNKVFLDANQARAGLGAAPDQMALAERTRLSNQQHDMDKIAAELQARLVSNRHASKLADPLRVLDAYTRRMGDVQAGVNAQGGVSTPQQKFQLEYINDKLRPEKPLMTPSDKLALAKEFNTTGLPETLREPWTNYMVQTMNPEQRIMSPDAMEKFRKTLAQSKKGG